MRLPRELTGWVESSAVFSLPYFVHSLSPLHRTCADTHSQDALDFTRWYQENTILSHIYILLILMLDNHPWTWGSDGGGRHGMVFLPHCFNAPREKTSPKGRRLPSSPTRKPVLCASFLKLAPPYCVALGERWTYEQWKTRTQRRPSVSRGSSLPALAPEQKATLVPKHPLCCLLP